MFFFKKNLSFFFFFPQMNKVGCLCNKNTGKNRGIMGVTKEA